MRRLVFLLLIALGAATAVAAEESAWQMVWRSEKAPSQVSLSGRVRTMIALAGEPRQATAEVWVANGKTRFNYTSEDRHWSLLDDGKELIRLQPETKRARISPQRQLAVNRELAERNYVARRAGQGTVAGRPVAIVEIVPRGKGGRVWRLWLDRATGFALKRERYDGSGRVITSTEFVEVDFAARPAAQLFDVPSGYTRVASDGGGRRLSVEELEARAGFAVRRPHYVPSGYTFLGGSYRGEEKPEPGDTRPRARRRDTGLGASAELRYTDGIRLLTVAQRPVKENEEGSASAGGAMSRGSEKAVRYRVGDRVVVIVGSLTEEELTRVAKSVQ